MKSMKSPNQLIRDAVADYRRATSLLWDATLTEAAREAFQRQADRALGALDALFNLHPNSPAWAETGWSV